MANPVKKANRELAEKKQENSFWCCVRKGSSKRWHLSLDLRKEPAPWRAGGAEFQLEGMAGSIRITEGVMVCLDSSLMNSDEIKAGWGEWVGGLYRGEWGTKFQLGQLPVLKSQGPQEGLRVHGCVMDHRRYSGLFKTEEYGCKFLAVAELCGSTVEKKWFGCCICFLWQL